MEKEIELLSNFQTIGFFFLVFSVLFCSLFFLLSSKIKSFFFFFLWRFPFSSINRLDKIYLSVCM